MNSVPQEFVSESLADTIACKAKAAAFLKERAILNDAAATAWCQDYVGITRNPFEKMEFRCWTRRTYYSDILEYVRVCVTESTDRYNIITDNIKTLWRDIKSEDETENDTITALILGVMRIESLGEMENNYLNIHEAIVSPEQYDIEAKRYTRSLLLGNKKDYKKKIEICIEENNLMYSNRISNTCYIIEPK